MPSPLRPAVSVLLLLLQLLGLGHAAWAKHGLSDSGTVVEVAPALEEKHQDRGGHVCADEPAVEGDGPDECLVLSGWRTGALLRSPVALGAVLEAAPTLLSTTAQLSPQLDVLSRAPKASPPLG